MWGLKGRSLVLHLVRRVKGQREGEIKRTHGKAKIIISHAVAADGFRLTGTINSITNGMTRPIIVNASTVQPIIAPTDIVAPFIYALFSRKCQCDFTAP